MYVEDDVKTAQTQESSVQPHKFTFFGSYDHSLDSKGRVIVPHPYRQMLGASFTLSITRDGKGIGIYPNEVFDELFSDVYQLNQRRKAVLTYLNTIAKYSYRDMTFDSQGRIQLPQKMREVFLGKDVKEVEISGALDHVRIVSDTVGEDEEAFFFDHREEILNEIADMLDE